MSSILFDTAAESGDAILLAGGGAALPILVDSADSEGIHIAARTFADDVERVTGLRPEVHKDSLPKGHRGPAVIAATAGSSLLSSLKSRPISDLKGKWESYYTSVLDGPCAGVKEGIVVAGSDRVSQFAL